MLDQKKTTFTYRCDVDLAARISALRVRTGWTYQKLTDEFYKTWLYRLQNESDLFRELTVPKQIGYVVDDMLKIPSIAGWLTKKRF